MHTETLQHGRNISWNKVNQIFYTQKSEGLRQPLLNSKCYTVANKCIYNNLYFQQLALLYILIFYLLRSWALFNAFMLYHALQHKVLYDSFLYILVLSKAACPKNIFDLASHIISLKKCTLLRLRLLVDCVSTAIIRNLLIRYIDKLKKSWLVLQS